MTEHRASTPGRRPRRRPPSASDQLVDDLYRGHALRLTRIALLPVGDQPSAEDVVQEAFLGLFRGLGRLNDPSRAVAYLQVSVLNGCRSVLPARKRARLRGAATDYPAVWSADVTSFQACTTQLYRFAIGPSGRPSRLTPPIADSQAAASALNAEAVIPAPSYLTAGEGRDTGKPRTHLSASPRGTSRSSPL